jgi:hypothetical protein
MNDNWGNRNFIFKISDFRLKDNFSQLVRNIVRRAFGSADGKEAKKYNYGFVKNTFRDLKSGAKLWSEITREDWQFVESEKIEFKVI